MARSLKTITVCHQKLTLPERIAIAGKEYSILPVDNRAYQCLPDKSSYDSVEKRIKWGNEIQKLNNYFYDAFKDKEFFGYDGQHSLDRRIWDMTKNAELCFNAIYADLDFPTMTIDFTMIWNGKAAPTKLKFNQGPRIAKLIHGNETKGILSTYRWVTEQTRMRAYIQKPTSEEP